MDNIAAFQKSILVVEDALVVSRELQEMLMAAGYDIADAVVSGEEAIDIYNQKKPDIILMDEPCSALDPAATAEIETLIRELRQRYTVIVVTHNLQQAARISDFTAFMYVGKLVEYGLTKNLFEKPENELVEQYITGKFG